MSENKAVRPRVLRLVALAGCLLPAVLVAHPTPFSNILIALTGDGGAVSVVAYAYDFAQELKLPEPQAFDRRLVGNDYEKIARLVVDRVRVELDGRVAAAEAVSVALASDQKTATVTWRFSGRPIDRIRVTARLFPYDPLHESFVTLRDHGRLAGEFILTAGRPSAEQTLGRGPSRSTVVVRFVRAGIEHIAVGPDHVLFLIGLLLLGGGLWPLVRIVTAFTLAHSVTLSLAVLGVVTPPSRLIEPAIALSICVVGVNNLIRVSKDSHAADYRVWLAFTFGLVHGFGFASVLRTMDLPRAALGWSLFAFNLGVEIGQLVIVVAVSLTLVWIARRRAALRRRIAIAGSLAVLWAGFFWFVQRVFFA